MGVIIIVIIVLTIWFIISNNKPKKSKLETLFNDLEKDPKFKELNKQTELHLIDVRRKLRERTNFSNAQIEDYIEQYIKASHIAGFSGISLAESINKNTNIDLSIII